MKKTLFSVMFVLVIISFVFCLHVDNNFLLLPVRKSTTRSHTGEPLGSNRYNIMFIYKYIYMCIMYELYNGYKMVWYRIVLCSVV